jgi:hypothetical protein
MLTAATNNLCKQADNKKLEGKLKDIRNLWGITQRKCSNEEIELGVFFKGL